MSVLRSTTFQLSVKNEDGTTKMRSFTRAVTDAKETTQDLNKTLGDNVEVTYKTSQTMKELTQQARMQVTQVERSNKAYRSLTQQLNHQIALVGKSESEQAALNAVMRLGENATEQQKKEVYELSMAYSALNKSQGAASGSMRNMRGVAQNFGWQLQDVVVQAQMGTDAFIILSQQGSQFAAAFGAAGAVIGAGIAIVGATLPAIISAMSDAEKGSEEFKEAQKSLNEILKSSKILVEGYSDELIELYKVDSQLAELKLTTALYDSQVSVESVEAEMRKMLATYLSMAKAVGGESDFLNFDYASEALGITIDEFENLRAEFLKFEQGEGSGGVKSALVALTDSGRELTPELNKLITQFVDMDSKSELAARQLEKIRDAIENGLTPSTEDAVKAVDELLEAYVMKTVALGQTERQQAIYTSLLDLSSMATDKEREAVVKAINTYYDRKDVLEDSEEAEKNRIKLAKAAEKQAEREAKAAEKNRIAQIKQLEKLEQMRVKQRDTLLKPIEADISKMFDNDTLEAESRKFEENMDLLNAQLGLTKEWEYSERARINTLIEQEQQRHKTAMTDISSQQLQSELNNALTFLQGMNQITSQLAGLAEEGSKEAELLFYANQAIAFANAIVNTEAAATRALAEGGMYAGIPMANIIRGIGYASAGIIAGTTLAGAFDEGGYIPSNQMGIVSEYGDELVNGVLVKGPARVTSREETAEMMNGGSGGSVLQPIIHQNITVNGNGDKALIAAMEEAANKGAERGAKIAYSRVSKDFSTGRGIRAQLKQSTGI